jgi:hypothetical protein
MKLLEKSDKLKNSVENANLSWDDLKIELLKAGVVEKEFPVLKEVQKWLVRANAQASDLGEHISKM